MFTLTVQTYIFIIFVEFNMFKESKVSYLKMQCNPVTTYGNGYVCGKSDVFLLRYERLREGVDIINI